MNKLFLKKYFDSILRFSNTYRYSKNGEIKKSELLLHLRNVRFHTFHRFLRFELELSIVEKNARL
jgi:hypothetical protein